MTHNDKNYGKAFGYIYTVYSHISILSALSALLHKKV